MKNNCPTNNKSAKGFTLIELLIVIAVLGVLAAVVLVAINPLEQLARGRDSGRKTTVGQLKNAAQAFYTSHNATYSSHTGGWVTNLTNAGELKAIPASISYNASGSVCTATIAQASINSAAENGWCYYTNYTGDAVVYTRLESKSEITKCPPTTYPVPFFLWNSAEGKAGVVCTATGMEPTGFLPFTFY
ncbi:MAG: prepilin-type N-terminal cleavage/methylation domain-containing protein [Candidatus Levybacteria bacterium]|nr:prepilin-type N-terminal cleavage/methylation domain-containing protein [Candidatus Levybacteria bacterium]